MSEPVFFAVIRRNGIESPCLFFDLVPRDLVERKDSRLVYCTRIDTMRTFENMMAASLDKLFATYLRLKGEGKLPVEDRGIKPKEKQGKTTISRERWEPPRPTWDQDAPAYPPLPSVATSPVICPCGIQDGRCRYPNCDEGTKMLGGRNGEDQPGSDAATGA